MARKLNSYETRAFAQAVERADLPPLGPEDEALLEQLRAGREEAMALSPELGAWFGFELPAWFEY
jgi:hypothetical protein